MKKIIALSIILTVLFSASLFAAKWQNSLKPKGKAITVNLVQNSKALYTIVIPENSGVNENLSSKDMAEYLEKIYSVPFRIIKDTENINGKFISLGDTKQLKASGLKVPDMNRDGYAIMTKNNNIYITGGFRDGSLNGVYALLEEDLGCRWYDNVGGEKYPAIKNGKLTFVPRSYSPKFLLRAVGLPEVCDVDADLMWQNYANKERPYMRRNRQNKFEPNGGAHTVYSFVPLDNYDAHPEWFSMKNGVRTKEQLCFSNEEMYQVMLKNAISGQRSHDKDTLMISPNDSYSLCECPDCKALSEAEGTNMAPYLKCMNRLGQDLEKEFPNLRIQLLAYLDYVKSPKTIKPYKNIEVMVCSDCCDWNYPLCTLRENDKFSGIMDDWIDKCGVITWNYVSNYDHLIMPNPNLTVIADDIKQMNDWGTLGAYLQGIGWQRENLQASGRMKAWVWGRLLWDPSLDTMTLLKDFCYGYFGDEIGDIMFEYETSLVSMYKKAHAMKHDPNEDAEMKIKDGLPVFNTPARENIGVVFDHGIRWTPDVKMYTEEWVNHSMKLMDKALALCKNDTDKEKVLYMRSNMIYLYLAQKLGYYRIGGIYVSKPRPSDEEIAKYKPLFDELCATFDHYGTFCIAEIGNKTDTKDNLVRKWNQILTVNTEGIGTQELPKTWKFCFDPDNLGVSAGWYNPDFDTKDWINMDTGLTWDEQGHKTFEGNAWYKTKIILSEDHLKAKRIVLGFPGVDEEATVYVNGKLLIERTIAKTGLNANALYRTPFIIDCKDALKVGENDVTVMVGNVARAGGLYKNVKLLWGYRDVSDDDFLFLSD